MLPPQLLNGIFQKACIVAFMILFGTTAACSELWLNKEQAKNNIFH